ncbi:hypothetical protein M407DRAFT_246808 [Tulasnella calospora MUT 4182]|uniref:Uncharacterized protein n=1 Tax=Tulasnella calospora MUT 4182 TaxID=1051891 RepID=A0A0C3L6T0_9AGAM|nr:hypothetical protein M407DRAFT_246808 [Tulasnella calospora MUT 4182]
MRPKSSNGRLPFILSPGSGIIGFSAWSEFPTPGDVASGSAAPFPASTAHSAQSTVMRAIRKKTYSKKRKQVPLDGTLTPRSAWRIQLWAARSESCPSPNQLKP